MIAGCPKCSARYRVDAERVGPEGAKLRCTKCSAVFLVRAPQAAAPAAAEEVAAPTPQQETAPTREYDRTRLVLIADPDESRGKACAEAVESWGLQAHLVHDGVEAMMAIQRLLPSAVVLDAALPKMFGFQVCEVVKRNDSLRETVVVLVGAIHHQTRYRRDPSDLYGADVYIEQPDLPDGLEAVLREGGLPMDGAAPSTPAPEPVAAPTPEPTPAPVVAKMPEPTPEPVVAKMPEPTPEPVLASAPEPIPTPETSTSPELTLEEPVADSDADPEFEFEPSTTEAMSESTPAPVANVPEPAAADEDPEKTEERERARRLARIAVSEMLLYQPEKFEQATRDGNLAQVLDLEIQEARALLRQRISEEVRAEADFVMDELERVAAERSSQG